MIAPGLIFGLIVGFALKRRGLAAGWRYPAFIIFSAFTYFAAAIGSPPISMEWMPIRNMVGAGVFISALGAAMLTAFIVLIIPRFRRWRTVTLMILAGAFSGLSFAILPFTLLVIFILWQASFAAAMSTALED